MPQGKGRIAGANSAQVPQTLFEAFEKMQELSSPERATHATAGRSHVKYPRKVVISPCVAYRKLSPLKYVEGRNGGK